MTELALTLMIVLFSGFDYQTTRRRLARFGVQAELNPAVRWLVAQLGLQRGVLLAVLAPMVVWSSLFLALGWAEALAFYAGMKGQLAVAQILSRKLEDKIAEEMGLSPSSGGINPPDGSAE